MERGTRLGPYEVLEQLGAGGMGQVWLAQDERLGRRVAIKVLPAQFAGDAERLARFEQEAKALAAHRTEEPIEMDIVRLHPTVGSIEVLRHQQ